MGVRRVADIVVHTQMLYERMSARNRLAVNRLVDQQLSKDLDRTAGETPRSR